MMVNACALVKSLPVAGNSVAGSSDISEKEFSDDHDHMCSKSFSRESWLWSSFFSSEADSKRTMTTCAASLWEGILVMVIVFFFPNIHHHPPA